MTRAEATRLLLALRVVRDEVLALPPSPSAPAYSRCPACAQGHPESHDPSWPGCSPSAPAGDCGDGCTVEGGSKLAANSAPHVATKPLPASDEVVLSIPTTRWVMEEIRRHADSGRYPRSFSACAEEFLRSALREEAQREREGELASMVKKAVRRG